MRTLSSGLLAAQQAKSLMPYIKVIATAGATSYTFDNQGYAGAEKRILSVEQTEEAYGGIALIVLRNEDQFFSTKNLRGYGIDLGWGAKVGSAFESSSTAPLFVWSQRDVTYGGVQATELLCLDLWWQIAANMVIWAGERVNGTLTNTTGFKMGELITSSPSGATGILIGVGYDNILLTSITGTFVGETSASGAVGSVAITSVDVVTAASGAAYGKNRTIKQIIEAILPASLAGVTLDSDDPDSTVNTYQPLLITGVGEKARGIIRQLLQMTGCGARIQNDARLHILYLDEAASAQYTYQTDHVFWYQLRERAIIMPNAVVFVDIMPDHLGNTPNYVGTAKHQPSIDLIGEFSDIQVNSGIEADGDVAGGAERFAKYWIAQRAAESYQGGVIAPMHCGQELYDMVEIVHPGPGISVKGRVGRIDRRYKPGVYEIELRLGGIQTVPEAIPGFETIDTDIKDLDPDTWQVPQLDPDEPPWDAPPWDEILPKAVQGYMHDIKFTSVSWQKIDWTAGTIKFYDGTTQSVLAGTTGNIATDDIYYIYFDLADASPNVLKVCKASDYLTTYFSVNTSVLCVVQRVADEMAIMLPGWEKQPLIVADMIHMAGLRNWTDPVTGHRYQQIADTQITAGQIKLSSATSYDTGYDPSTKRRNFHTTPTTPYEVGDLWHDGNVVKRCTTTRLTGSYSAGDWTSVSMDQIADGGTYSRVLNTSISAGKIRLDEVVQYTNYQTATSSQKSSWTAKPENMDQIGEGTTYKRVRATQIDAGYLKLTSQTVKSGEWYDQSGVEIDASHGINIYGTNNALTTRATKTGTIQCYVGSDGKFYAGAGAVRLDSDGIRITGTTSEWLRFYVSTTWKGNINLVSGTLNPLNIWGQDGIKLVVGSATRGLDCTLISFMDLPRSSTAPSTSEGRLSMKSGTNFVKVYIGGAWRNIYFSGTGW